MFLSEELQYLYQQEELEETARVVTNPIYNPALRFRIFPRDGGFDGQRPDIVACSTALRFSFL
jgi:hypothetical protein